ncbi:MAG: phosphatidylserine decarboxylase family protein [Desulfosalsimonadaceae bacterium]
MNEHFNRVDTPQTSALPVAEAGYPFIFAAAFATLVFALLDIVLLALAGLAAVFFITFFFRDPERFVPDTANAVVSPADGRIVKTEKLEENPYIEGPCIKIGIFMTIFDVHVNRVPCSGRVEKTRYQPGCFLSAGSEAASLKNEHQAIVLASDNRARLCFVQVAGLIARRIICRLKPGDSVNRGERFGMICFGSRLDVYLPQDAGIEVRKGQKVKAGQTVLGHLP